MEDNWEKNLGVLYIESKIPISDFFNGNLTKDKIVDQMKKRNLFNLKIEKQINEMFDEIEKENLIPIISAHTPISGKLGRKFNLIFDRKNLDNTEEIEIVIKYAIFYQVFLQEFPEAHHCILLIQELRESNLIKRLAYHPDSDFRIGFCDKSKWPRIKKKLTVSKKEFEDWKKDNAI